MAAKIRLGICDPTEIGTVPAGKVIIFLDPNDNILKVKKDDQTIKNLEDTDVLVSVSANDTTPGYLEDKIGAGAGIQLQTLNDGANETLQVIADVQTVFGRVGNVVATAGDYSAIQITFDDSGPGVNGATVQAAIDDLGTRLATLEGQTYVNSYNGRTGVVVNDIFQATQQTAQIGITAPVAASFDVTNQNVPSTFNYNSTTGILVINKAGKFRFEIKVTCDTGNGARQTSLIRLQKFNGSVFADLPVAEGQSRSYGYHRNSASGENTSVIGNVLDVVAGDQYRVLIQSISAGPVNSVPLATSLLVEEI